MTTLTENQPVRGVYHKVMDVLGALGAVGVLVLCVHSVLNAVLRSLGGAGLTGTLEIVGFWYMPVIGFLGFSLAKRNNEHIDANIVYDHLPRVMRRDFDMAANLFLLAFALASAWFGWNEAVHNLAIDKTAGITSIPVWPASFLVPLGCLLLALQSALDGWRAMRERSAA
ncbi:TRAP transporter small permease [Georgenia sp. AZ-5]|uniref:TRAP transporter small permease n=1 Tax=Georgenia sp. AZ-5 TaxID=3367526 RepID=UPI00375529F1